MSFSRKNQFDHGAASEHTGLGVRQFGDGPLGVEVTQGKIFTPAEQILQDIRSGLRMLRRFPLLSAGVIVLIAIGIGGNVAMFSIIHAILTKSAPGVTGDDLVMLGLSTNGRPDQPVNSFVNYLDCKEWTRNVQSLVAMGADRMTLTLSDGTYELRGQLVSPNYFDTLGVHLAKGRVFTSEEANGAGGLVAIIAWHVWQNQFQRDQGVVGRSVVLNSLPATIVGVTSEGFQGTQIAPNFEVGVPIVSYFHLTHREVKLTDRADRSVVMMGKLSPGKSISDAQVEFNALSKRLEVVYPDVNKGKVIRLAPYSQSAFGVWQSNQAKLFMSILIAVGLLTLLVVCANVANLLLARSITRQREMAVRQALGATRARILRVLLAEALVLTVCAAFCAFIFAWWLSRAVVRLIPPLESGLRLQPDLSPDWKVTIYAIALAGVCALVFTLAPTIRAWKQELLPWLKSGERGLAQGRSTVADILVVLQVAFSVLLLTAAGLAVRSLRLVENRDLHFPKDNLLLVKILTSGAASTENENIALLERLRERLQTLPGIVSASYASGIPPSPSGDWTATVRSMDSSEVISVHGMDVGPDYLKALGVGRLEGKDISKADVAGARKVVVATRQLAKTLWPGESGLGRALIIDGQVETISGIAPDGAFSDIGPDTDSKFLFLPERDGKDHPGIRFFHLRYVGNPQVVSRSVRSVMRQIDDRIPIPLIETMQTALEDYTSPGTLVASLLGVFSAGSLFIASAGLYATVAFNTARRTRDFGIRMAVGASSRQILQSVLNHGLLLAGIGSAIGLLFSVLIGRAFRSFLYGVGLVDYSIHLGVALLLITIASVASYLPARRASRVDPMQTLRED